MLQIVPIVELVLATCRKIHCRDQDTLRHRYLPPVREIMALYSAARHLAKATGFRPVPVRCAGPHIDRSAT
jgi:hypothetical protein